jgi:23S rRNA (cytosine1962-C5)-methyltransferase
VARMVERGHPWVYREALSGLRAKVASGAVVDLVSEGRFVGRGIYDPSSPLAVRVHTRDERVRVDAASIANAIDAAWKRRDRLFDATTTAYRVVNGEGDRIPGIVIDRYDRAAVLRLDSEALLSFVDALVPELAKMASARGVETILLRSADGDGDAKARVVWGRPIDAPIDVLEHGMTIEVDLLHGQKTGAFLDQRENRRRVRALAKEGARVLNLFSYTGGFSLAAALGGASSVTSVDVAAKAHATAQRTFKKNGVDPSAHAFVTADATSYVAELERRGERFDIVISDPPSFAPNEKSKQRGLAAYAKLHRSCVRVVAPGGLFCASSCSSHVPMTDFLGTLDDRALERGDLSILEAHGQPADHPTLAAFPEGRYLKFVVCGR